MTGLLLILLLIPTGATTVPPEPVPSDYVLTIENATWYPITGTVGACFGDPGRAFATKSFAAPVGKQWTGSWPEQGGVWGCVRVVAQIAKPDCGDRLRATRDTYALPNQMQKTIVLRSEDFQNLGRDPNCTLEPSEGLRSYILTVENQTELRLRVRPRACYNRGTPGGLQLLTAVQGGNDFTVQPRSNQHKTWSILDYGCVRFFIIATECPGYDQFGAVIRDTWILPNQRAKRMTITDADFGRDRIPPQCDDQGEQGIAQQSSAPPPPPPPPTPSEPLRCPARAPAAPYLETHTPMNPVTQWVRYPPLGVSCGYLRNGGSPVMWMLQEGGGGYWILRWDNEGQLIKAFRMERNAERIPPDWTEGGYSYGVFPDGRPRRSRTETTWRGRPPQPDR